MESSKDVIRKTRQQVNDKPSFEIVHADDARFRHDLAGGADERQVEVEENIDEEDHINDTVYHQHWHVVHRLTLSHVTTHT